MMNDGRARMLGHRYMPGSGGGSSSSSSGSSSSSSSSSTGEVVHAYYHAEPPAGHRLRADLPACADYYPWACSAAERESTLTPESARQGVAQRAQSADWDTLCGAVARAQLWAQRPRVVALFEQLALLRAAAPAAPCRAHGARQGAARAAFLCAFRCTWGRNLV